MRCSAFSLRVLPGTRLLKPPAMQRTPACETYTSEQAPDPLVLFHLLRTENARDSGPHLPSTYSWGRKVRFLSRGRHSLDFLPSLHTFPIGQQHCVRKSEPPATYCTAAKSSVKEGDAWRSHLPGLLLLLPLLPTCRHPGGGLHIGGVPQIIRVIV